MKIKHLFLCLFCLGAAFAAMAQNQVDKQGRKQGLWIRTDKDGSKIYQGTFKDNLEVDTFTYYYPNGQVRLRNVYSVPGKVCQHQAYDPEGHLLATGTYNQKNRDGEWKIYNESGRLVKIANYRMGVRQGLQVIFNSNGDTAEVSSFLDNHRNGRWWKRVGERGSISGTFVKGNLEGRLVELDDQGAMVREGFYKGGEKEGPYRYYENGQLTVEEQWQMGVLLDKKVLLTAANPQWVSIHEMAFFYPKGSDHCVVVKKDGSSIAAQEDVDLMAHRINSEIFSLINKTNRIYVNTHCVLGLTKDGEGREILHLDPAPSFSIFPDEDGMKCVKALHRGNEMDE